MWRRRYSNQNVHHTFMKLPIMNLAEVILNVKKYRKRHSIVLCPSYMDAQKSILHTHVHTCIPPHRDINLICATTPYFQN